MARLLLSATWVRSGGLVLLALSWLLPGAAASDNIVLTLDGLTAMECLDTWVEAGVTLQLVPTTEEDCGVGACNFGPGESGLWLYPSRLEALVAAGGWQVVSAEIDIRDNCGVGCTRAFMYAGTETVASTQNQAWGVQTLTLEGGDAVVDRLDRRLRCSLAFNGSTTGTTAPAPGGGGHRLVTSKRRGF